MLSDDFLGEAKSTLIVRLHTMDNPVELQWLEIWRLGVHVGDILAAFELLSQGVLEDHPWPPYGINAGQIPPDVAPRREAHTIEVWSYEYVWVDPDRTRN